METPDNEVSAEETKKTMSKYFVPEVLAVSLIVGILGGVFGAATFVEYQRQHGQVITKSNTVQQTVDENSAIISTVKTSSPAVVSITGQTQSVDFFGNVNNSETAGTGFLVSKDGLILTNKHVVSDSGVTYNVYTSDGKMYKAKIQATDPSNDIALLKIDASNLPYLTLGDSNSLQIGQEVVAIGNALGQYQNTVTTGVISALDRSIQAGSEYSSGTESLSDVIQTDVAINLGNSGGPLINLDGQVIGINTATDQQGQSLGFAIPINDAKGFLQQQESAFSL
jgi:serine protease Do